MSSGRFHLSRLYRPSRRRRFSSFHRLLYYPDGNWPAPDPSSDGPAVASAYFDVKEETISFGRNDSIRVRSVTATSSLSPLSFLRNLREYETDLRNSLFFFPLLFLHRLYRPPHAKPHQHVLYFPPLSHRIFPPRDLLDPEFIAPRIAAASCTTVIVPLPEVVPVKFPESLHALFAIHDYFREVADQSQPLRIALLSAGLTAPLAAAIAASEKDCEEESRIAIHALGIWFGVLNLTDHITGVAYSPSMRQWKFFNPPNPKLDKAEYRLGMSIAELTFLRLKMFPRPEMWTDPFASPMQRFMHTGVQCDPVRGPAPRPLRLHFPHSYRTRPSFISGVGDGVRLPPMRIVVPTEKEPDEIGLRQMGINYTHGASRFYQARWLQDEGKVISEGPDGDAAIEEKITFLGKRYQLVEVSADGWEQEVMWMGQWLRKALEQPRRITE